MEDGGRIVHDTKGIGHHAELLFLEAVRHLCSETGTHKEYLLAGGYLKVGLTKDGKSHKKRVNRLVAMAFIDNPNELPFVDHIDGNKENNSITNLRWVTDKENREHAKVLRAMAKAMNT